MTKRTHISGGLAMGLFLFNGTDLHEAMVIGEIVAFTAGSVFPDMDLVLGMKYENTPFKHRGILHSLITPALIAIGGYLLTAFLPESVPYYIFPTIILPFVYGILFHLFLDSMTMMGIQPFIPFSYWKFNLFGRKGKYGRGMRVGSVFDGLLMILFIILVVILFGSGYNIHEVMQWLKIKM